MFNGKSTFPIFKSVVSVYKYSSDFSVTLQVLTSNNENEMESIASLHYEVNA